LTAESPDPWVITLIKSQHLGSPTRWLPTHVPQVVSIDWGNERSVGANNTLIRPSSLRPTIVTLKHRLIRRNPQPGLAILDGDRIIIDAIDFDPNNRSILQRDFGTIP